MNAIELAERGWLPDVLVRAGMRQTMAKRLKTETRPDAASRAAHVAAFVAELDASPIAIETRAANSQHYEVPAEFFRLHLGPRLKYSSCFYATDRSTLAEAEEAMLATYAERAQLADGQRILDLGCGWGSFALWAAERFPRSTVFGLSNSASQRAFIESQAAARNISNLTVRTGNIVDFEFEHADLAGGFDRIVSIEMLEHMKNYRRLFAKLAGWLKGDGRLFAHIFANRVTPYHFEDREADDWMTRYFFTGGTMPSFDLFTRFSDDLVIDEQWWVSGRHYERTANDWLRGMDARRGAILEVFAKAYPKGEAARWFARWRMFYMAVAELFGFEGGETWGVAHYRFVKAARGA